LNYSNNENYSAMKCIMYYICFEY